MAEATEARANILARIRAAKPLPSGDAVSAWQSIRRDYHVAADLARHEVFHLLEERLLDYDAHVFHCDRASISGCVERALHQRAKHTIALPEGIPAAWLPSGFHFVEDQALSLDELDRVEGVLTAATLAIADTGTIVLQNSAGQGRRAATLVPDYHLCILFADQVVQSVPQAMRQLQAAATLPTTIISGPSATADIEMTRIKGVHGPRFLDVILVNDPSPG